MEEFPLTYIPDFLFGKRKLAMRRLEKLEYLTDEESAVVIRGKRIFVPRIQAAFGDAGLIYRFSGSTTVAKEWPHFLLRLRNRVHMWMIENSYLDGGTEPPNFVFVNKYRNGRDYIGFHSDDERDLKGKFPIISISLGEKRDFVIRRKNDHGVKKTNSFRKWFFAYHARWNATRLPTFCSEKAKMYRKKI